MSNTIPAKLKRNGTDPAYKANSGYFVRENGSWIPTTYGEYYKQTLQVAQALIHLGIEVDGKICILAFNRPEWVIADMAAMMIGAVPAGIYQTCSPEEVEYIISHSESKIVVVENEEQWKKVKERESNLPLLEKIVLMKGCEIDDDKTIGWEQFVALGDNVTAEKVFERLDNLKPEAPATFIYTAEPPALLKQSCSPMTTLISLRRWPSTLLIWRTPIVRSPTFLSPTSRSRCSQFTHRSRLGHQSTSPNQSTSFQIISRRFSRQFSSECPGSGRSSIQVSIQNWPTLQKERRRSPTGRCGSDDQPTHSRTRDDHSHCC